MAGNEEKAIEKDDKDGEGSPARGAFSPFGKPYIVQAIFAGLLFSVVMMMVVLIDLGTIGALDGPTVGILGLFGLLFLLGALMVLKQKTWTLVLALVPPLILILLYGPFIADVVASPAVPGPFPTAWALFIALFFVVVMSVIALLNRKDLRARPFLATADSKSGLLTGVFIGIIVGGLIVGLAAGGTITRILTTQKGGGGPNDVDIVYGAGNPGNQGFYSPESVTVTVANGTITWHNKDTMSHTVTADDGSFDSESIAPGAMWSYKFTKPGTFKYHCAPHPWMTGTVIVT